MIPLAIVGLVIFGVIGGGLMCEALMVDGCFETLFAFMLGVLASIGVYVGIAAMIAIIIVKVF